jgi:hypothetical protein
MLILPHYFKDRISFLHGHYYCSFNFHCLLPPWLFIPVPISVWFPLSPLDVFINILWSLLACLRWAPKKLLGSFFRYGVGLIYWWSWMAEPLSVSSSGLTWTALLTRQRSCKVFLLVFHSSVSLEKEPLVFCAWVGKKGKAFWTILKCVNKPGTGGPCL